MGYTVRALNNEGCPYKMYFLVMLEVFGLVDVENN